MRLFIIHDDGGAVQSWIACPDSAPAPRVGLEPGQSCVEVEPPAGLPEDPLAASTWLQDALPRHRVVPPGKGRLVLR